MSKNPKPGEPEPCQVITIRPADSTEIAEQKPRSLVRVLRRVGMFVASSYDPKPMEKEPEPPEDFDMLLPHERAVEVYRYQWNKMLYRISHRGGIQAFWKLLLTSVLVVMPTVAVLCLVGWGIAYLLMPLEFASITALRIAVNVGGVALVAVGMYIVINGIGVVAKNQLIAGIFTIIILIAVFIAGLVWFASWLPPIPNWLARWVFG